MSTSGFWFYGRLAPGAATRFRTDQFRIGPSLYLELFDDGIALWCRPGQQLITSVEEARELMRLMTAAYALVSGVALDLSFEGWVEAKQAQFGETIVGFTVEPRGRASHLPTRSRQSVDMRRAALLAVAARSNPGWRLAIRDVHAALRDRGDDAFVLAYRALEDIARAASGQEGQLGDADWAQLHRLLGTTKDDFLARIQPLHLARRAAGHGDENDPNLHTARTNRDTVVEIARRVVGEALHAADLPLRLENLR